MDILYSVHEWNIKERSANLIGMLRFCLHVCVCVCICMLDSILLRNYAWYASSFISQLCQIIVRIKYNNQRNYICLHCQTIQFGSVCALSHSFIQCVVYFSEQFYGSMCVSMKERDYECMGLRKHSFPVIVIPCCDFFLSTDVDCTGCCCQVFLTQFLSFTSPLYCFSPLLVRLFSADAYQMWQ